MNSRLKQDGLTLPVAAHAFPSNRLVFSLVQYQHFDFYALTSESSSSFESLMVAGSTDGEDCVLLDRLCSCLTTVGQCCDSKFMSFLLLRESEEPKGLSESAIFLLKKIEKRKRKA